MQTVRVLLLLFHLDSFSFSFLIAVAKNSKTMLNSGGESRKCFQFFTIEDDVCFGFIIILAFIMLRYFPSM